MGGFFGPSGSTSNNSTGGSGFVGAYIAAAAVTGGNNDFNPGGAPAWPGTLAAPYGRLDLTGAAGDFNLSGLLTGLDGQEVIIRNATTHTCTLNDQNAASAAANRFAIGDGTGINDLILPPGASITAVYYTGSIHRWVVQS